MRKVDPDSPVLAMMLERYSSFEKENLVASVLERILWFILVLMVALFPITEYANILYIVFAAIGMLAGSFVQKRRMENVGRHLMTMLANLDEQLVDEFSKGISEAPTFVRRGIMYHRSFESFIWFTTLLNVAAVRLVFHSVL